MEGEFSWHHHENEDELFWVIEGQLTIELPDQMLTLNEGEMAVIPQGMEHRPIAAQECFILLLEPAGTLNTGNIRDEHTHEKLDWI